MASTSHGLPQKTEPLLARAREGDQLAWRALFERHQLMLLATLELKMPGFLRRTTASEDVLQDALLKAWKEIGSFSYEGDGSFRRWLRRIVLNEFRNHIRSWHAEHGSIPRQSQSQVDHLPCTGSSPSGVIVMLDQHAHLLALLAQQPEEDQDLFVMRLIEEKTWDEIASILGCSRDTASQRMNRLVARLGRGDA